MIPESLKATASEKKIKKERTEEMQQERDGGGQVFLTNGKQQMFKKSCCAESPVSPPECVKPTATAQRNERTTNVPFCLD